MTKRRHVRLGDSLDDEDIVVVRGGELDADIVRADALRHHDIYGMFGISVFAAQDVTIDELAQQPPLVRFEVLTLVRVGVIRAAGLRIEPTGRNPRHFTVPSTTSTPVCAGSPVVSTSDGATRTMTVSQPRRESPMDVDLVADLNAEDDDRLGWSTLGDAREPQRVRPGVMLLAGNRYGRAVVRIVGVDDDGQVHFAILPGSVEKNRHLLGRTVA